MERRVYQMTEREQAKAEQNEARWGAALAGAWCGDHENCGVVTAATGNERYGDSSSYGRGDQ